jgi:hypothetical protein
MPLSGLEGFLPFFCIYYTAGFGICQEVFRTFFLTLEDLFPLGTL